jgi:hypothetical protein
MRSKNFASWLRLRMIATGDAFRQSWLNEMENEDVESWAKGKSEREVEELLKRIQDEMVRNSGEIELKTDILLFRG